MSTQGQDEEQGGGMILVSLILFGALTVWAIYTTFLVVGGMMDDVLGERGDLRFALAIVLSLIIPVMTAMGFNSKKEDAKGLERLNRIFIGSSILSFGTAAIVALAMTQPVMQTLTRTPNWFMKDRHAQSGPPDLNRRYSAILADGIGTVAHKAGVYYYAPETRARTKRKP